MARTIMDLVRFILRRGFLPRSLVFTLAGLAACAHRTRAEVVIPTCYEAPIDTRPRITGASATPNPTGGADTVRLTATLLAYSGGMTITGADVLTGLLEDVTAPVMPVDGAFDSDSEDVFCEVGVSGFAPGPLRVYIVAWDSRNESGECFVDILIEE